MKLFGKDLDRDVVVVAEVGVNHEGDVEAASRLVKLAAAAGADAVKLQTYTPSRFVSASDPTRLARVTRFGLDEAAHRRLAKEAAAAGIPFFSSAITEDVVPLLAELGPAIKIASGDLTFEPVIRAAAKTGRIVILSTGLGTTSEVDAAVRWVEDELGPVALRDRLVLLHCVSAYPTPVEEANVRSVPFLAERYGVTVGYSNHVVGPEACLAAVALGAAMLEVHFTDQKSGRTFRDHELSLEASDLAELIRSARKIRASLGRTGKERQPSESGNLAAVRKGVVAARDLQPGKVLERGDLMFARPATEIPAAEIGSVVGRRLKGAVRQGELIARANLAAD